MPLRWMNPSRNLIRSASILTPSTEKPGSAGAPVKQGLGSATAVTGGAYTGPGDAWYRVEIDSTAAGTEIGQATFRWTDGGPVWNATGVTVTGFPQELNHGLTIKFVGGPEADFAAGDVWEFLAVKHFGRERLLDLNRDTGWRSAGLDDAQYIRIDLGEARRVETLIIADHNFSETAETVLQAHASDEWSNPAFETAVPYHPDLMAVYLDGTYRFWRIAVADPTNPDGFIRVGELFLGSYLELAQAAIPDELTRRLVASEPFATPREAFSFDLLVNSPEEALVLRDFFRSLHRPESGRDDPFFFCRDPDDPSYATRLVRLARDPVVAQTMKGRHRFRIELIEAVRSDV